MVDESQADHWTKLASELGAAPPPERGAAQEAQQASVTEPESQRPADEPELTGETRYDYRPPEPQRTATDWARLAQSLGLVVEPEAVVESVEGVTSTEVVDTGAPVGGPPAGPDIAMESAESEVQVVDVLPAGERRGSAGLVEHVDTDEVRASGERISKRTRRRRRRRRSHEEVREKTGAPDGLAQRIEEVPAGSTGDALIVSPIAPLPGPAPGRKKRRRRRRSAAKERQEERPGGGSDQTFVNLGTEPAGAPANEAPRLSAEAAGAEAGPLSGAEDEEHGEDLLDEDGGERPIHRGIPTWLEAVNIVINRNMEFRAKNPGGPTRSRGNRNRG